jgi:hypothetical protein
MIDDVRHANSPTGTWDLAERLAEMDRTGVDAQAVAVVPFTLGYHWEAGMAPQRRRRGQGGDQGR